MFGYIIPNKPELRVKEYNRYRGWYCGLCKTLKEHYGLLGEITLSYDMTFLIILLNSLYEPEETLQQCRCAVHPMMPHTEVVSACSEYGAAMNVVLMYYKMFDDYQDDKRWMSGAASWLLKKKVETIEKQYPRQVRNIRKELDHLNKLERSGVKDAQEAARAFGRLLGNLFIWKEDLWKKDLYIIGYDLGIYIYLLDAWKDLPEDLEEGHYNPLPYEKQTVENEKKLREFLMHIMADCAAHLERLPLIRDTEILRNIVYSGVWMMWKEKEKKGCLRNGKGSI